MDSKNEVTKDKYTYGITTPLSFNSTIEQVTAFEKSFNACIRQPKYQPNAREFELPVDWKEKFESWVTANVYELLKSDYIKTIDEFFDHLKQRLIKNANYLDLSFLEWLKKACTEASIDKQTNDFRTFVKKAFADGEGKVLEIIARNLQLPDANENLPAKTKDNLIQIITQCREGSETLSATIALEYADLLTNHVMMSMVGQNPNAFTGFSDSNAGVCPKNSRYDKINLFYSNKNPDRAICYKVGSRKSEDKEFQQLKEENERLKAQIASLNNTNRQLKLASTGTTKTTAPTPKAEVKNLDNKRPREKYNGVPCSKCTDPLRAATHSSERHKDTYVERGAYKKQKHSDSKK